MLIGGKNKCDRCKVNCFTCGSPKKILIQNGVKKELCSTCYNIEKINGGN